MGLPIVRLEDFYEQGHDSDEDRLFEPWFFDYPDWLMPRDKLYLRLRNGLPGVCEYEDSIAAGVRI